MTTEDIGPSLAGDQLSAGLTAGGIGLALVMLYCLLYYRGLGLVVVSSLFVAAAITYGMVLLLSESAGFTLTLPGIAGLIIAIGITADSFVIYFERIRDEMRDGKSMRVAVETGWARARVTRIAANTVSILSALVLYIFATGAVKGFGFALGLSTLIDLAVLFWFTKPLVSWLAQFKAFNSGHRLSGLSPETLGLDAPQAPPTTQEGTPDGQDVEARKRPLQRSHVDRLRRSRSRSGTASASVIVGLAIAALFVKPLNFGVEFRGGTELKIAVAEGVDQDDADDLREAIADAGIEDAENPSVTTAGSDSLVLTTESLSD